MSGLTTEQLPERRSPTHILRVDIPLHINGERTFDPLQDALRIVLSVSRLAVEDVLCDDPNVTLLEPDDAGER